MKFDKKILDHKHQLKSTKNKDKLKVTLRKDKLKGVGLYAKKNIKKGEIIAFYKLKVFIEKKYKSPTNYVYTFDIYDKRGKTLKKYIGDITERSFPKPYKNIPFWAPFANEPSINQKGNSSIDINEKKNSKANNGKIKEGDKVVYFLVADRDIKKGEEILWYYGDTYDRDYEVNEE